MAGVLLSFGQEFFLEVMFNATNPPTNLYLGLMENGDIATLPLTHLDAQIYPGGVTADTLNPARLVEVSANSLGVAAPGTYVRQALGRGAGWTRTGQVVTRAAETVFTVDGPDNWLVKGYFVALSNVYQATDAIWCESFIVPQQGYKVPGDNIRITPKFEMEDNNEGP